MSASATPPSFEAIQSALRGSIYRPSGGKAGVLEVQTYTLMVRPLSTHYDKSGVLVEGDGDLKLISLSKSGFIGTRDSL